MPSAPAPSPPEAPGSPSSPPASPMGPALALGLALVLGLILRLGGLGADVISPDEGRYLESAGIHELDPDSSPTAWPGEDLAWARGPKSYPHSYLHQWVARQAHRAGTAHKTAIRAGSVLTSMLTALGLAWVLWRRWPARPWTATLAGALVALTPLQVWYARTGWGTTGCTLFVLVAMALGWRLAGARDAGARLRLGLALTLAGLAAYGYHEMASVYVVALGLALLALELFDRRPAPWRSPALWTWALSSIPVGLATIWILLFSDFANEHWFDTVRGERGYFEARQRILGFLFLSGTGLPALVTLPVVGLALTGAASLVRRAPREAVFLLTNLVAPFLLFLVFFQDTNLIRIHLPGACLVLLLAAEGVTWLAGLAGGRARHVVAGLALALLAVEAGASRVTLTGEPGDALFRAGFFGTVNGDSKSDLARREGVVVEHIAADLRPRQTVQAVGPAALFFLRDAGIAAEEFTSRPSRYVVGRPEAVTRRLKQAGGPVRYRQVELEGNGYWVLYERDRSGAGVP